MENNNPTECPDCGGKLVERVSKKDGKRFLGCENFATKGCNYTFWGFKKKEKKDTEEETILEIETLDTLKSILASLRQIFTILEEIRDMLKPKS